MKDLEKVITEVLKFGFEVSFYTNLGQYVVEVIKIKQGTKYNWKQIIPENHMVKVGDVVMFCVDKIEKEIVRRDLLLKNKL